MTVRLAELSESTWPALERLFGPNGAVAGCWCTWFLQGNKQMQDNGSAANRALLRERVCAGTPTGLLALDGPDAQGWVAVGPRPTYPRLARSTVAKPLDPAEDLTDIWAVTCFFVHRTARRSGLAATLLDGAIEHARASGARAIEGYPVDTSLARGSKIGAGELYHGTLGLFTGAGFAVVRGAGERRSLVRLSLR